MRLETEIDCFADTYQEARQKFLSACASAGATVQSFRNPHGMTPCGAPLATDVACIGAPSAKRILLTTSGTHGQEGFPGSAAQIQLLQLCGEQSLPEDVAIVMVHAVNPWGWANFSRTTERNVDLNRNFIDHAQPPRTDPLYARIDEILTPRNLDEQILGALWPRLMQLAEQCGMHKLADTLAGGQYDYPRGLNYGGRTPEWSNMVLQSIVSSYCAHASKIALIDWHTGLGAHGEAFYMCFSEPGNALYQRAAEWWGEEQLRAGAQEINGLPRPKYAGLLWHGVQAALPHAQVAGAVIEFGTYPIADMMQALVVDRWLKFCAEPASENAARWREWMIERFYPSSSAWRESCLTHARSIHQRAIAGLTNWRD